MLEELLKQLIDSNETLIKSIENPNISRQEVINFILESNQGYRKMLETKSKG